MHSLDLPMGSESGMRQKFLLRYEDQDYWRKYQEFFPIDFQCQPHQIPREEYVKWRSFHIHLDRIDLDHPSFKIILLHGASAYGRLLAPLSIAFAKLGASVVAPDLPPFGLSRPRPMYLRYADWVKLVSDLIEIEVSKAPSVPVVLFGMSMGGMLAYHVANSSKHVLGIVATTLADMNNPMVRSELSRSRLIGTLGWKLLSSMFLISDFMPVPLGKMSCASDMSNNEGFNRVFHDDPLRVKSSIPFSLLRTMADFPRLHSPEQFKKPVLLVHPAKDMCSPLSLSLPFFEKIRGPKKLVELENCGHAPIEGPGIFQLQSEVGLFLDQFAQA